MNYLHRVQFAWSSAGLLLGFLRAPLVVALLGSVPLSPAAHAQTIVVTVDCSPNGDIAPKGTLTLPAHSDLDVTATPNPGYEIYDWYVNGETGGWSTPQHHFAFGDLNVSIYVLFSRITNYVRATVGDHGRLNPDSSMAALPVGWGESLTFTATPDPHYHVDTWTLDENGVIRVVQTGGLSYTLANVTQDMWLGVSFAPDVYTVQASATAHGTLSPSGAVKVAYQADQLFTALPEPGYDVVVWLLDGQPVVTNLTAWTLQDVQTNHALSVTFSPPVLRGILSSNTMVLSWPTAISDYSLQESTYLPAAAWTNVSATPNEHNGRQEIVLPRTGACHFFRLGTP